MKDRDHDDIHFESLMNFKDSRNLSCDFVFVVRDIEYCKTFANSRTDSKDQRRVKLKTWADPRQGTDRHPLRNQPVIVRRDYLK